ncbi:MULTISPECIES: CDP-alcohol phosphatidyltransferase family protein [unclassified Streptomyces]|uniref:CDP-alcohol phosphatidyltransferase family protein n=1 Tax=unclassified Streptomyces TaxID=2593676 RepID=UPI000381F024|nr:MULTISPECIES: CDP-alcohol phosphatidyltransferase family protein [unclassified Streptomyces]MYT33962.1 CDP-alcohol phosphatidyltransferase family protein [Streptomyces sp. SID8354]
MAGQVRCGARPFGLDLVVGTVAQLVLLAVLCRAVGLGPAGWLAGVAFAAVTGSVLARAVRGSWQRSFGPANRVTLARATLVGGVTALVADSFARPVPVAALAGLAAVALALDAVDGPVARRTGTATALGARFDMEVDAFLILVLSLYAAGPLGPWVPAVGALRYLFVAASWVLPWLRAPLPPSMARKTVAAVQGVVLVAADAGIAPWALERGAVAGALALLVWSFGRDVGRLWRTRERAGGAAAARAAGGEPVARAG